VLTGCKQGVNSVDGTGRQQGVNKVLTGC